MLVLHNQVVSLLIKFLRGSIWVVFAINPISINLGQNVDKLNNTTLVFDTWTRLVKIIPQCFCILSVVFLGIGQSLD